MVNLDRDLAWNNGQSVIYNFGEAAYQCWKDKKQVP